MKLSVIIPCYNEIAHIAALVDAVEELAMPKEIIVVDDGSTDGTTEIVEEFGRSKRIIAHLSKTNFGKGAAIRTGLEYVTGDIVVIQDADLEYDPRQIPMLIAPIADGSADVVYGSRFRGSIQGMRPANRIANYLLAWMANILYRAHITDEATCYKAFRTDILKSLNLKCVRFEFCPEVTAKVRKRGINIFEVPIDYVGRTTLKGKKIKLTDAFEAVWTLIKYRFTN
ncbi:MAG: glycosyltransferase family 2 protein [Armatimonadetes bacterium]|nr:glycosyltransferase family 2 protein [Armatimonadota bacterium]